MIAKLLWHFDVELEGDHSTWVDGARFYVSVGKKLRMCVLTMSGRVAATAAQGTAYSYSIDLERLSLHERSALLPLLPLITSQGLILCFASCRTNRRLSVYIFRQESTQRL